MHIKKELQAIDTIIVLPSVINELLICQGDYDIRDTSIWNLAHLGTLLEKDFDLQEFIPPYSLRLTDKKDGRLLAHYRYGHSSLSLWTIRNEIPLGFLEHHLLTAEFIYPASHFWLQEWTKIIITLGLFFLLILSTWNLFVQLRNEKKSGEYRKKFTHTLVHNLRSPVIFLKQQLECIETLPLSLPEQQGALKKCQEKASRILKDIEHLLSTSVNAYGLVARCETFDLSVLINKIAAAYRQNQPEKKVSISIDQPPHLLICADPILLEGALGNLVGNSIKYSGTDTRIRIGCRQEKNKITITIADNGFGIPPEEQEQIFQENYRGRKYMTDRGHKGFGLGLYYVQAVVIAHRGHISVKSEEHNGSDFTIEIPRKNTKS